MTKAEFIDQVVKTSEKAVLLQPLGQPVKIGQDVAAGI